MPERYPVPPLFPVSSFRRLRDIVSNFDRLEHCLRFWQAVPAWFVQLAVGVIVPSLLKYEFRLHGPSRSKSKSRCKALRAKVLHEEVKLLGEFRLDLHENPYTQILWHRPTSR